MPTRTYTPAEAAALLSVSRQHIYNLIRLRALPASNVAAPGARRPTWVITAEAIDDYLTRPRRHLTLVATDVA